MVGNEVFGKKYPSQLLDIVVGGVGEEEFSRVLKSEDDESVKETEEFLNGKGALFFLISVFKIKKI